MDILISGVGGQGALLASRIFASVARILSQDIKISEVHGMSQRGGSVVTHVRMGEKIYSPVVEKGAADFLMAFEQLEGARYVDWLKEGGSLILNNQELDPMPVASGNLPYPSKLIEELGNLPINLQVIDGASLAKEAGNMRTVNTVLIGLLASKTDIDKEIWLKAVRERVPEKFLQENLKAFDLGYDYLIEESGKGGS